MFHFVPGVPRTKMERFGTVKCIDTYFAAKYDQFTLKSPAGNLK